jgi:UDP-N-acetylmuramyl pentapeptide phosphotransferase/UDP-N-acetylglucosamine-1-phosphate transferase
MIYLLIFILLSFFINEQVIKKNILNDNLDFSWHKKLTFYNKNLPVSSGYIILFFFLIFYHDLNILSKLFILIIFFSGALSDRLKNFSPILRLSIHFIVSLLFIVKNEVFIVDTRILLIDNFFDSFQFISILFTVFCLLVLINGTNFIDGVNLNAIAYYTIIYLIIIYISYSNNFIIDNTYSLKFLAVLVFLMILNSLNKTQLGDGGAYLLAFLTSVYLINFVNLNTQISPYFIILLLWYPCFENLFSIIRKKYQNKKISLADNLHLHQLIFILLKKNNISKANNLTGLIIIFYNLPSFILGIQFFDKTKILLLIILVNVLFYIFIYNKLIIHLKFRKK